MNKLYIMQSINGEMSDVFRDSMKYNVNLILSGSEPINVFKSGCFRSNGNDFLKKHAHIKDEQTKQNYSLSSKWKKI